MGSSGRETLEVFMIVLKGITCDRPVNSSTEGKAVTQVSVTFHTTLEPEVHGCSEVENLVKAVRRDGLLLFVSLVVAIAIQAIVICIPGLVLRLYGIDV